MDRNALLAGLLPVLMLYACDRATTTPTAADPVREPVAAAVTPQEPSPTEPSSAASRADDNALVAAPLAPEAAKGVPGAQTTLNSFARAIELKQLDKAWAMLGATAKSKWSKAAFDQRFAGLQDVTMVVPEGTIEGAAGSSFYTSQAVITARDSQGRPVRLEGPIVLRRVNDIEGATPEQLRWHIESADLSATR